MAHRYRRKQTRKENKPVVLYLSGYDRLFLRLGWWLVRVGRHIAKAGRRNRTRPDKMKMWIGAHIAMAGWRVKEWRYPPRSRRNRPC